MAALTVASTSRVHARISTRSRVGVELSWDSERPERFRLVRTFERHDLVAPPAVTTSTPAEIDMRLDLVPFLRIREQELARIDVELVTHLSFAPEALAPDPYLDTKMTTSRSARMLAQSRGDHDVVGAVLAPVVTPLASFSAATPLSTVRIVGVAPVTAVGSLQLGAADRANQHLPVTWSMLGGVTSDSISADGVLDVALPAQRRFLVVARAADGREDFVVITVI